VNVLSIFHCPNCFIELAQEAEQLRCSSCRNLFTFSDGIFNFLEDSPIAASFGFQWNQFPLVQLDSFSGDSRSRERFLNETKWDENTLKDKLVLDAGCGSGRFSEIALSFEPYLVMVDASDAISATKDNLSRNPKATFVKASLLALPFKDQSFDYVYCIGVLQHTSDPYKSIRELCRVTKIHGQLALTFYERTGWQTLLYSKYLVRPLTKRIPKKLLLGLISRTSVIWFPLTNVLFRLPGQIGRLFRFMIPIANYVNYLYSKTELQRTEAILDTFDMLSPEFDSPLKKDPVVRLLEENGFRILDYSQKGNLRAEKIL